MKKIGAVLFLLFHFFALKGQDNDSALISELIQDIAAAQVQTDGFYYKGAFPSYRECRGKPHNYQPDNNVFFTAIGIFTLRQLLPELKGKDEVIVKQVIANAGSAFPRYQNKNGLPLYSFWATGKGIMPGSYFLKYFEWLLSQGDDADDAAMVLMATNASDSVSLLLKQRMIETSNLSRKKITSTYRKYRQLPAYSTYLGYRMTPDFDFGVHCNLVYFTLDRALPLVKQDSATIQLIAEMVHNRDYRSSPTFISPYYVNTPVLLYHLARLMGRFHIPALEPYKAQLIADMEAELKCADNDIDKILLSTSLLRLGATPVHLRVKSLAGFEQGDQQRFIFFQARAAFFYPIPLKNIFLHLSYLCYNFYAPAYNKILLLEYLIERNRVSLNN